ncbi:MAG: hypothetical protein PHH82_03430 [Candidatus ainarchaeum sp.]|nr:hypothetical protein [Candidatus ainarchaeum sp.]
MTYINQGLGYGLVIGFGLVMFAITWFFARWKGYKTKLGFLLAGRNVGWILGGATIAASWIWAPALFVSSQMAYTKGLAGIFWFTVPNVLALILFAFFAPQIRKKFPEGYTLPEYIKHKLKSESVHKIYLFPYFFYQLMSVAVQLFAGSALLYMLTGINIIIGMILISVIVLAYTLVSGFEASVVTDLFQLILIYVPGIIIVVSLLSKFGFSAIVPGLNGIESTAGIFDPSVAFAFGIVTAIGLISGAISDQQYWQRSFAIKKDQLKKAFVFGGILFGLVPIGLSILGFIAANPAMGISLPAGVDVSLIGVQTVATLLPTWIVALFVLLLLGGLCSTFDSGLSATSSLFTIDVLKSNDDKKNLKYSRIAMVGITALGLLVALAANYIPGFGLKHLWWIFNTIAACVVVPTVLSLYWEKLNAKGVFWGVLVSFFVGIPLFIYGNVINNAYWIVFSSLGIIAISALLCVVFSLIRKSKIPNYLSG